MIAREADVRMLALTHISARYAGRELRAEARALFERTELPRDFDAIEIPLPDRGEPHLVRAAERRERPSAPAATVTDEIL
jgi:ribonuclease Z